jgi:hypothetical protein
VGGREILTEKSVSKEDEDATDIVEDGLELEFEFGSVVVIKYIVHT